MKKQNSLSAAYGYQADLFGATPVKKKIAKPAPERYEALRVLALRYGGIGVTATQYAIKTGEVYYSPITVNH